MISTIFHTLIYNPIYNGLIFLLGIMPGHDVGVAIIVVTIIVRLILFPLSKKAVETQIKMKEVEPELNKIKEDFKNNREEQARRTMALYSEKKLNPFSSILVLLIQIPVILALYYVFIRGGLPNIQTDILYPFVHGTVVPNMDFLGFLNIGGKSVFLALLAGISQFFQIRFSMPIVPTKEKDAKTSFKDDLARSMNLQMRYVMPVFITFIAWSVSGAVSLYWVTSNLFTIGQELVVRKKLKKQ